MSSPASSIALTGANQVIRADASVFSGFAVRETGGAAGATVRIWDHASAATGTLLEVIRLAPNESAREHYGDGGIWATKGIFVELVAGAVEGAVRVG